MRLGPPPTDMAGWVAELADPPRARRAYWHLVATGPAALPAVRAGLADPDADVRMYCTQALDHLVDGDSFPLLVGLLGDEDARVRRHALHALACDRCKTTTCRPEKAEVLPAAIATLQGDPDPYVRVAAAEVVGRWTHDDAAATAALTSASTTDPSPVVRKKASWYAPGGPIYRRTAPKGRRGHF